MASTNPTDAARSHRLTAQVIWLFYMKHLFSKAARERQSIASPNEGREPER